MLTLTSGNCGDHPDGEEAACRRARAQKSSRGDAERRAVQFKRAPTRLTGMILFTEASAQGERGETGEAPEGRRYDPPSASPARMSRRSERSSCNMRHETMQGASNSVQGVLTDNQITLACRWGRCTRHPRRPPTHRSLGKSAEGSSGSSAGGAGDTARQQQQQLWPGQEHNHSRAQQAKRTPAFRYAQVPMLFPEAQPTSDPSGTQQSDCRGQEETRRVTSRITKH
jgi:hypothetical protein